MIRGILAMGIALCVCPTLALSQTIDNVDHVVKIDQSMHRAHRAGQVLVKFKDASSVSVKKQASGRMRASSVNVQNALQQLGVTDMEQLMPVGGKMKVPGNRRVRKANGEPVEDRDLSNLYLVKYDTRQVDHISKAVDTFEKLDEVEFAEPNYLVFALGSPSTTEVQQSNYVTRRGPAPFTPSDPLYEQQWGPAAINLPQLWQTETQDVLGRRPVIAILDTGVDIDHPDLKDNIWTNEKEQNGVEGHDDDQNGYADDLHGWDCVNQTGRLGDWNGHGTHCAGIAAAVQGNGIGVVGANPDALIMPVTVLQSDGTGDVGTIIRGLEYTLTHQVDVVSMSLGSYGYSMAEELALGKVYHNSVIVAAAGNDGLCIYPGHNCCSKPLYPGAFTFVLGVEASKDYAGPCFSYCGKGVDPYTANPWRACFSNLDDDGPIYTDLNIFDEEKLYNYELLVPGTNIISTYPKGRYKMMNGTSMATPLAAGAISRLLQVKEYSSKELLFGDLIGSANKNSQVMDVMAAYNLKDVDRKPSLMLVNYIMRDSIGGDNDGRYDAGETIELYPVMRNSWGEATGIKCSLTVGDNEDTEIIQILENNVDFGRTLHSYGKEQSVNPIRFKINENCVDGRRIRLQLNSTCENGTGKTIGQDFIITVENGEVLEGIMEKNTTLDPDKHYIITKSYAIPANLTLTIPAGTTIKFHDNAMLKVSPQGRIRARGTAEKPIIFTKGDLSQGYVPTMDFNNYCVFEYCQFVMLSAEVNLISGGRFTDCIFKDCYVGYHGLTGMTTTRCNIIQNTGYAGIEYGNTHTNSNVMDNKVTTLNGKCYHGDSWYDYLPGWKDFKACNLYGNYIDFMRSYANLAFITTEPTVVYSDYPSYLGTADEEIARKSVLDYYHELNDDEHYTSFGKIDLKNMLTSPSDQAHGVVWKILVDGVDAQDDYEMIPPLGVGTHKVDVYFNREMDTLAVPYLAMGVRPPYTQNFINENPSWSSDGKVYTAYITINAKSAFDGINRFYVADAQDKDHFAIPVERSRFNVPVSAAGSKSVGFVAEAGLGLVKLSWEAIDTIDVEDVMGYNVYRYTIDETSSIASDTTRVNPELIMLADGVYKGQLTFTDYNVTPGTTYYYYYRALRSTLDSTEPSLTVAATPATSTKGDANGSMDVTVADVVSEIDYLTDQNPQPFIFEAADVNSDQVVNILDVVGTINIILNPAAPSMSTAMSTATYTIEDGLLYIESPVSLAGLQILFDTADKDFSPEPLQVLEGMEYAVVNHGEESQFISYSLANRVIPAGRHAVLRVGDASVKSIVLSDVHANDVKASYTTPTIVERLQPDQQYKKPEGIYNLMGIKVQTPRRGVYISNGKKVCY